MLPIAPEEFKKDEPKKSSSLFPNISSYLTQQNLIRASVGLAGLTGAALLCFGMFKHRQTNAPALTAAPKLNLGMKK